MITAPSFVKVDKIMQCYIRYFIDKAGGGGKK